MDRTDTNGLSAGMDVFGADGEKVGVIAQVHPDYVVVEKGLFFPTDYYVPTTAVARVEAGEAHLNVTKDEAVNQGWENPPATLVEGTSPGLGDESYDPTYDRQGGLVEDEEVRARPGDGTSGRAGGRGGAADSGSGTDEFGAFARAAEPAATAGMTGSTDAAATAAMASMPGFTGETAAEDVESVDDDSGSGTGRRSARSAPEVREVEATSEAIRVPVHEEELIPVTKEVRRGAVRIEKEVVTEERTITVPVTEERLRITRLTPVDGTGGDDANAFAEEVIEIPIRGEEVVSVEKRPRVMGEVVIEKEEVQRTERVGDTVRREELRVEEEPIDAGESRES